MDPRMASDHPPSQDGPPSPRISVVIAARNDPKRLARCLAALKASTLTDHEVIVGDDGSTDNTPAVAESMGATVVRLPRQSGAAAARNAAAELARASILMFVDADVVVHPDTLAAAAESFNDPSISAIFGSYDLEPSEPNLLSQFKNLSHRFYHQESSEEVATFWTGCGAMRREVFEKFKFDAARFARPSIEDIDLGVRVTQSGGTIRVNKRLQATHLKLWTLKGIIKSDVLDRAIPWTQLIHRSKDLPIDLNLGLAQRLAAVLTAMAAGVFLIACWFKPWLLIIPPSIALAIELVDRWTRRRPLSSAAQAVIGMFILAGAVGAFWYAGLWLLAVAALLAPVLWINRRYYRFFLKQRGWFMALTAISMQLTYYLYSLLGFGIGTLVHWWESRGELDNVRTRTRVYIRIAIALYIGAWSMVIARKFLHDATIDFAVSDATGYYAYLPSVVIDRDLNFSNQLEDQGQADSNYRREMARNRWQTGVAMSLLPAFLAAHLVSVPLHWVTGSEWFAPHGYSVIYFAICVAWAMGLGTLGLILADRLVVQRLEVRGRIAFCAVLTTWLGTNYLWYFVREPLLAHMIGASWVILSVYLIHRIERNASNGLLRWWQLPLLGFAASMALACRLTNGFMFPIFLYLLVVLIQRNLLVRSLRYLPLMVLSLTPLLIQWLSTIRIHGTVVATNVQAMGYNPRERFVFDDPALLLTLFSSRHGLLFSTPALLLAAWGVAWQLLRTPRRRDGLIISLGISAIILWYLNAAWIFWWFGPSVGHRGFVELAGFWLIGFALAYEWLRGLGPRARWAVAALLILSFAMNAVVMSAKMFDLVGENDPLIPWENRLGDPRENRF